MNTRLIILLCVLCVTRTFAAEVIELGRIRDDESSLFVRSVSGDGSIIPMSAGTREQASVWTRENGRTEIENVVGIPIAAIRIPISADGQFIAGHTTPYATREPLLWSEESGARLLGHPEGSPYAEPVAMSDDGSVLAIRARGGARRWTSEAGFVRLPMPEGSESSSPENISADGTTIVGWISPGGREKEPAKWVGVDDVEPLGLLPEFTNGWATDVSADGSVVVGNLLNDECMCIFDTRTAFRWTREAGIVNLGPTDQERNSSAHAVSHDGRIVFGSTFRGDAGDRQGFMWDEINGMRDLENVLRDEYGVKVPRGLRGLDDPFAISANGRVIVGETPIDPSGINFNHKNAWAVFLDRPLVVTSGVLGDFNGNGELDVEDLDLLADELQSNRNVPLFDVNSDAVVNIDDRRHWVHSLANTYFGDANLDGEFNSGDFTQVFLAGEYEDTIEDNSGWAEGDWDGDGDFTSKDMVAAFLDGGYELGPRNSVNGVPEPRSLILLVLGSLTVLTRRSAK